MRPCIYMCVCMYEVYIRRYPITSNGEDLKPRVYVSPSTYIRKTPRAGKTNGIRIKTLNVSCEQVWHTRPCKGKNNKNSDPDLFRVVHTQSFTLNWTFFFACPSSFLHHTGLQYFSRAPSSSQSPVISVHIYACCIRDFYDDSDKLTTPDTPFATNKQNKNINLNLHRTTYRPL